jgi:hypothetical protein
VIIFLIGETNAAFDEYSIKNEQQPVLRSTLQQSLHNGQRTTSVRQIYLFFKLNDDLCVR